MNGTCCRCELEIQCVYLRYSIRQILYIDRLFNNQAIQSEPFVLLIEYCIAIDFFFFSSVSSRLGAKVIMQLDNCHRAIVILCINACGWPTKIRLSR